MPAEVAVAGAAVPVAREVLAPVRAALQDPAAR
jgi:hypothetical protein